MRLTVYADILIITNFIVDYFLLDITGKIVRRVPSLIRSILSAFFASLTSLLIFLPEQNRFLQLIIRISASLLICFVCFGFTSLRRFLFTSAVFCAVTFCYAGAMMALWYIFKPYGMAINNSVVYFDISPLFLIVFSVAGFLIFTVISSVFTRRSHTAKTCTVTLCLGQNRADFLGFIDSGNSLSDVFLHRPVIIADRKKATAVFGDLSAQKYPERYCVLPCKTVSSNVLLDGFRCDSGQISDNNKTVKLNSPVMALSKTPLFDCEAIVNPLDFD